MPAFTRFAAALLCACAAVPAVHAQKVRSATNTVPSSSARIAQSAPKPTGLTPTFPAGVTSGSGASVSTNPIAQSTSPIPAGGSTIANTSPIPAELPPAVTTPSNPNNIGPATNVLGAGAAGYGGGGSMARGPGQTTGGAGGINATDAARMFFFADADHDGSLTRAEFGRLGYATMSFEEMDRNFDGVISRFEYDDSLR